jgi:subtilisin-like proprotein convertase family protein
MRLLLLAAVACACGFAAAITQTSAGAASIPENNSAGVSVDIIFSDARLITGNLSVSIHSLNHSWMGDLTATVTHIDTGITVNLFQRPGRTITGNGCSDDFNGSYTFSDSGAVTLAACNASSAAVLPPGTYRASDDSTGVDEVAVILSSAFTGQAAGGTWRLFMSDVVSGDTGSFANWTVSMDVADGVPEPGTLALVAGGLGLLALIRRRG